MSRRERPRQPEPIADQVETVLEEQLDRLQAVERPPETAHRVERGVDVVEREQRDDHVRRRGTSRRRAAVITASVPSLPHSRPARS